MRYSEMWPKYAAWWDKMIIKPDRMAEFEREAHYAIDHKAIYQQVEVATTHGPFGVHWYHVALLHRRESNANFHTYLGNGQSLDRRTTLVPAGRGPFLGPNAFVRGCLDALAVDGLSKIADWRLEKILYYCEAFNGFGYASVYNLPSPYVWGGTNIQRPGKYIADRRFSSTTWDPQPGCAPLLATIAKFDPTVTFTRET